MNPTDLTSRLALDSRGFESLKQTARTDPNGAAKTVANKPFATIDDLAETLDRRCSALSDEPAIVSASTSFHWWPEE